MVIKAKAGAKDRLYGSITNADIAEELSTSAGLVIDKRKIELETPIHEIGSYEIPIRLTKDIIPKVKLSIIEEEKVEGEDKKESKAKKETKPKAKKKAKAKAPKAAVEAEAETREETAAEETKTEGQEETG
jgi:hypothetical protein